MSIFNRAAGGVPADGMTTATVSARVAGGGTIVRVGSATLRRDVDDAVFGARVMKDDGSGSYADNGITAPAGTTPGPRTVRVKAESKAADGKRHAVAVDFRPFAVQ